MVSTHPPKVYCILHYLLFHPFSDNVPQVDHSYPRRASTGPSQRRVETWTLSCLVLTDWCAPIFKCIYPLVYFPLDNACIPILLQHSSPYCCSILLWISRGFTPSDHKNRMVPRCSSTVHTAKGVAILFLRPLQLHKLRHLSDSVKIFSDNGPFLYRSLKDIRYLISEILAVCPYLWITLV